MVGGFVAPAKRPGIDFPGPAGFIVLYDFLELLQVPGIGSLARERFFWREIPALLLGLLVVYFLSHSLQKRSQLEEQLRLGELTYKGVFDAASDAILVLDRQSLVITDVNRSGCEQYGYRREEMLGKKLADLLAEPEKSSSSLAWESGRIPLQHHRTKNGTVFPVEIVASSFSRKGKEYLVGIVRDISDRKRSEQALRQSEERFRALYEDNPSMYFIVDGEGTVLSVNRYGAEHLGYGVNELVGKSVLDVFHNDDKAVVAERLQDCFRQHDTVAEWELRQLHKNGSLIWVREYVRGVRAGDGQAAALIVCDDITERKKAEQKIQQLNAELESRVAERTRQLQVANRELEAFSYSVSHDLRAPLRAISGFSEALLADYSDRLDEQGLHYLTRINVASQRMGHLIDALLSLSRIMKKELHLSAINLSELAQQVMAELSNANPKRQVEFVVKLGLKASADPGLIRIVLENLIGNAWKYTAKREQARIEFGSIALPGDGSQQAFFVRDNGVGFDMAYAGQLFRVFQRLHSKKEFEGEGIGLTTVFRIVQRHGGKVWAEGAVNEGACFYFTTSA